MSIWSRRKNHPVSEVAELAIDSNVVGDTAVSDRFRRTDTVGFSVGDNLQLIYSMLDRSPRIISSQLFDLLDHCQEFKTLDDLANDYLRSYQAGEPKLIKEQLSELVEAGLLISEAALFKLIRECPGSQNSAEGIASIGVTTRNRIDSLHSCLESYIQNKKKYGRANDFVVMDDSELPKTRSYTRQMLSVLKSNYDVDILYSGLEEKMRFAEAIAANRDLPPETVKFALLDPEQCGCSIGANRNRLLLHTIGDMIFCADDDTLCRVVDSPRSKEGLALDSSGNFMQFWFFPDRESMLQSDFLDRDVLKSHELLLGRSLKNCLSTVADHSQLTFDMVSTRQIRGIQSGLGKVLATLNGMVGDSGIPAPVHYLLLDGDSRQRLTQSKAIYRSALTSREVLRVVDRLYISDKGWCATGALGLDNRLLLPPFMPVQRGEDDLFGFTMRACFSDGYFGYLPQAILHSPLERRTYPPESIQDFASSLRTHDIVLACITSFNVWPSMMSIKERLGALGRHLTELGSMTLPDFEEFVRINLWRMQSDYISFMEAHLQSHDSSPQFWAHDVEELIDTLRKAMEGQDYVVPQDLLEDRGLDEARKLSQRLVLNFGQLLCWWPEIVEAARDLRAQGQRLAAPI